MVTKPHQASDALHRRQRATQPEAADGFDPTDTSEPAVIARAFRRTDRELDTSAWDAVVHVCVLPCGPDPLLGAGNRVLLGCCLAVSSTTLAMLEAMPRVQWAA